MRSAFTTSDQVSQYQFSVTAQAKVYVRILTQHLLSMMQATTTANIPTSSFFLDVLLSYAHAKQGIHSSMREAMSPASQTSLPREVNLHRIQS